MSSSLGKLPDLSAKEEPEESLPPEPVSGGTFTSENVTNTQASPESSNTAPKNEESKQDSPAGTQEISDEEAEVLDFLLTIQQNTGSMLEVLDFLEALSPVYVILSNTGNNFPIDCKNIYKSC